MSDRLHRIGQTLITGVLLLLLTACVGSRSRVADNPPPAPREFRAAWVATVANIDWPSQPGLPVEQQRAELIAILDRARDLHLNALILQVRCAADALYPSELEPWSEYLTGAQGRAPVPFYDPLQAWIEAAHQRGIELHAWINPYRARHNLAKSDFAENHLAKTHPDAVKHYGDFWWMDPGDPVAMERTLAVVTDIARRYDVDGIHIDDYFYPYPIPASLPPGEKTGPEESKVMLDFPDEPSWAKYRAGGGQLERADWRRSNVDQLVARMYRAVHAVKPAVKFGISPFGLGRPDRRPPGVEGFSQYDKLYADVERWCAEGWLDYLVPQLYWPVNKKGQPFAVLLDYWARQNLAQRHLWPGLFTSSINDTPKSWAPEEILQEIDLARADPRAGGQVHFSMIALLQNRQGIADRLQAGPYAGEALVPATPWLGDVPPAAPRLQRQRDGRITVQAAPGHPTDKFAVWRRRGTEWKFSTQPARDAIIVPADAEVLVVSAVDRLGNESPRVTLVLPVSPQKP